MKYPKNCTTCEFHKIYYDALGFDGCSCIKKLDHNWCWEWGWVIDFDPRQDCGCVGYKISKVVIDEIWQLR